ncbi:MAG: methylated-DNA--[protein]-cysteine S-methyltransferase [Oscillospiraceae bacterium]|nr:methylated-DNA--[protein]-cysteine S-methyltransferase [Oscillospiraceae bacterium]
MFFASVYDIVRRIPHGKVATYGQVARLAGNPRMARQVGWALAGCPDDGIPCHRVVNRFGGCSSAFAFGGEDLQRALLKSEGVGFTAAGNVDLNEHLWIPPPVGAAGAPPEITS